MGHPLNLSCQAAISARGKVLVTGRELAEGTRLDESMVFKSQEQDLTSYLLEEEAAFISAGSKPAADAKLAKETVLTWEDVALPLLVRRGEPVTIFVEIGSIQVEAAGRALADGRLGQDSGPQHLL